MPAHPLAANNMPIDNGGMKRTGTGTTSAGAPTVMASNPPGMGPTPYITAQSAPSYDAANILNAQFSALNIGGANMSNGGAMMPNYVTGPDGQLYCAAPGSFQLAPGQLFDPSVYNTLSPACLPGGMAGYIPYPAMIPFTPGRGILTEHSEASSKDVPGLDNRRSSQSTTESTPATPFFGSVSSREPGTRIVDRSAYTTPSPNQLVPPAAAGNQQAKPVLFPVPVDRDLEKLLAQSPAIPQAVPAVFTPQESMKTLEQSLVNHIPGNRNVYIRGLHPTTDDDTLYKYASRFGKVETSKAIIDTATGACKGFGFAKFFDVRDSQTCIRGFYRLGYEVGFARESFNSRLKAEGDESSTNLYLSNLPKALTEAELPAVFLGYTILSCKILRDSSGNSRSVGFARFESRDVCDEIIREYNGTCLGEEGLPMNIRYADTPAQKELKRITSERRQFRTNEYNVGAYGTPLVGMAPTIYNQPAWRRDGSSFNTSHTAPWQSRRGHRIWGGGLANRAAQTTTTVTGDASSSADGSGDEGATIHVESPVVAVGSTRSSPTKQEKKD